MTDYQIERLLPGNLAKLQSLLVRGYFVHRHNDWLNPEDILNEGYVFTLYERETPLAVMGLSAPANQFCWLHFLVLLKPTSPVETVWKTLFHNPELQRIYSGVRTFFIPDEALMRRLSPYFAFKHEGEIVFLQTGNELEFVQDRKLHIKMATQPSTEEISSNLESSFPSLWRLSIRNIERALEISDDKLFFQTGGKLIGYLLTNVDENSVNISRLAVASDSLHKGIGSEMIRYLFDKYQAPQHRNFTVNTYAANHAAIALYKKFGFALTERSLPVYSFYNRPETT